MGPTVTRNTGYPLSAQRHPLSLEGRPAHPTQKPVALFEYLIRTYTNPGDLVLDCCMGSGTTAIACLNTNRRFVGFELDPEYCRMAQDRIDRRREELKNL